MTRIRVGANLLWLLPDQAGGAEEYVTRVLEAVGREAEDEVEVTILCNRLFASAHPGLAERLPTAVAPIDGGSRPVRIAAESTWLRREATRRALDVVHHFNNVVPWMRNRPSVLTIHDLRPMAQPESLGRGHGMYLRWRLRPSVRRSAAITTPSAFVRRTVLEMLGGDPARVFVVSAPVVPFDTSIEPDVSHPGLEGPFFVYPATTNPHKNHRTLLEAFVRVNEARPDTVLVLTGAAGAAEDEVTASISRHRLGDRVRRLGRVPRSLLHQLLRTAAALVYPSRYEGFGLPLAEAMALGCPVIAADRTALPEVVADAGLLLDPDDVEGWAGAMLRLEGDGGLRDRLVAAGKERVKSFTPGETAARLVQAYRLAASPESSR